ncbi:MAG TPA: hypothetical protein DHV98_06625, partial [Flavobacteriaceae bacterium]|nr:hypothetical protein [Flavobacteriaceae bacterium]
EGWGFESSLGHIKHKTTPSGVVLCFSKKTQTEGYGFTHKKSKPEWLAFFHFALVLTALFNRHYRAKNYYWNANQGHHHRDSL